MNALAPSDAATHQFGASLRYSPSADQELMAGGFDDEQTGIDYPGRLLTADHFLLRAWRASYRRANLDGVVSNLKFVAYVNKKSHCMSNRGKPTAMDMPGRTPPFALDVSLPPESDTVGGAGRVELSPGESWPLQAGIDFFRLEQNAQRFVSRASNRELIFSDPVWAGTSLSDTGAHFLVGRMFDRGDIRAASRLDLVNSDARRPTDFFLRNASPQLSRKETNASFSSIAGRYELGAGLTVAGGTGRVVRTASSLELYSDRFPGTRFQVAAEFIGDPAVRPESSRQADLTIEWKAAGSWFHAGGFLRSLGDYITVAPAPSVGKRLPLSPPAVFRYVNGRSAFFRGWNVGMRRVGERLQARFRDNRGRPRTYAAPYLAFRPWKPIRPFDTGTRPGGTGRHKGCATFETSAGFLPLD